jgi:serine/threonine protein phosphatase PrpC
MISSEFHSAEALNMNGALSVIPTCMVGTTHSVTPSQHCTSAIRFASAQHDGYKSPTEDRVVAINEIIPGVSLFAVLDGHGGTAVVDFVAEALPKVILEKLQELIPSTISDDDYASSLEQLLVHSFLEVDEFFLSHQLPSSGGSTATVALVTATHVVVANVGDSPCIAFSKHDGEAILYQTQDHDLKNHSELSRVLRTGGNVGFEYDGTPRVNGSLAVTRAFGHRHLKQFIPLEQRVITGLPQTYSWRRTADMCVILCSDSFTEVLLMNPKPVIRNNLDNTDILRQVYDSLVVNNFDLAVTVESLVEEQTEKFFFPHQGFAGDNTSIVLVDLSLSPTSPSDSDFVIAAQKCVSEPVEGSSDPCVAPNSIFKGV